MLGPSVALGVNDFYLGNDLKKMPLSYFGLAYFGRAPHMSLTVGHLWGEVGVGRPRVALRTAPPPRNPRGLLCCLLSPVSPTSLLCPGQQWETPNFVPAIVIMPPGISVTKSVTLPLSLTSASITNVSGPSVTRHMTGGPSGWCRVTQLSGLLPVPRLPTQRGLLPGPAGDLYDILSMIRKRNLWIFF